MRMPQKSGIFAEGKFYSNYTVYRYIHVGNFDKIFKRPRFSMRCRRYYHSNVIFSSFNKIQFVETTLGNYNSDEDRFLSAGLSGRDDITDKSPRVPARKSSFFFRRVT